MERRIYAPMGGLEAWKSRLADPDAHWRRTKSAFETAVFWELGCKTPRGIHPALTALLDQDASFAGCELVASFPEHRVKLPGGSRASQNDVWAILRSSVGLISLAVEGKAGESFDRTLGEWRKDASEGKDKRLAFLCDQLGVTAFDDALRYQLVHRAASAIIEAERIGARNAAMVVVSFVNDATSKSDFGAFVSCLGSSVSQGKLLRAVSPKRIPLFLGWLDMEPCTDAQIAAVVV